MAKLDESYRIIPCKHGVCASPSPAVTTRIIQAGSTKGVDGAILLPGGLEYDVVVDGEATALPALISLDNQDIQNLHCGHPDNFSFTHYGPISQDKPTNQDFALSGHFEGKKGEFSRFSILADGMSNGFGFPQRGAQISCFAAYECLKDFSQNLSYADRELTKRDVRTFKDSLSLRINRFLEADRTHLLSLFSENHHEPTNIGSTVWNKYIRDVPRRWYGNTLIVSFLSPFGGLIVYAGDGCIVLHRAPEASTDFMRSDEYSVIYRYVTLGMTEADLRGVHIGYDDGQDFVEVISATDGVDRTYQKHGMNLSAAFSSTSSLPSLIDQISNLPQRVQGDVDVDNYSIGRVFLALSDRQHARLTGQAGAVERSPALNNDATSEDVDTTPLFDKPPLRGLLRAFPAGRDSHLRSWGSSSRLSGTGERRIRDGCSSRQGPIQNVGQAQVGPTSGSETDDPSVGDVNHERLMKLVALLGSLPVGGVKREHLKKILARLGE